MHIKSVEEQVRLVAHPLLQALILSSVKVILKDGSVVGMGTLLDNFARSFARAHSSHVCKALFADPVSFTSSTER